MAQDFLVTQQGTFSTASLKEIFIFTHAVHTEAPGSSAGVAQTAMNAFKGAWASQPSYKANIYLATIFTEATAAEIIDKETGKLGMAAHVPYSPTLFGTGAKSCPTQCAIAVSLSGGAKENGTPYRGRFYLPAPDVSALQADGVLSGTTTYLNLMKDYFTNLKGGTCIPSIWSRKMGILVPVSTLRVGNKVDTIRSRRNELPETYSSSAVTLLVDGEEVSVKDFDEAGRGHWHDQ